MEHIMVISDILFKYTFYNEEVGKENLLDNWASIVVSSGKYGFEDGLLGLGWLVAYLGKVGKIDCDVDEVLEDIDDMIYKLTIKEHLQIEICPKRILDFVTFYQMRLYSKGNRASFHRKFVHFECLKLLVEKLNQYLLNLDYSSRPAVENGIEIILKYSLIAKVNGNEGTFDTYFYSFIEQVLELLESGRPLDIASLSLLKLYCAIKQYEHPYWEKKLKPFVPKNPISKQEIYWGKVRDSLENNNSEIFLPLNQLDDPQGRSFLLDYVTNIKGAEIIYEKNSSEYCRSFVQ
ncbi:hypothetical protein [Sphingobacterium sp. WOUb80]|uniref:hypothetical protein n=1 Tax=Sphingobacterium sp. WOUb80 TaxID=3234028 RepID=UPI003CF257D6